MKENMYDNPAFFEKYGEMLRSKKGLEGAGEWPTLEQMLPDFKNRTVLDLGCGYGWHCMYAASSGAVEVLGIDLSEKMLQEAIKRNTFKTVEYRQLGIEDFEYPMEKYDVVISSLALHYIEDVKSLFSKIKRTLVKGGIFVFTIEHPIYTAEGSQDWLYNAQQEILCWPLDNYFKEGYRQTTFLGETVVKYHHTLTTLLQGLLQAGFTIKDVVEPQPTLKMLEEIPAMKEELRRPMMIAISAIKR